MSLVPDKTLELINLAINAGIAQGATKLIAIDGRGGSGKSTLANALMDGNSNYQIVSMDDFPCRGNEHPFHPLGTQTQINWQRVLTEVIEPLKKGIDSSYRKTPWWMSQISEPEPLKMIHAGKITIIEGITSLRRELREYFDLKIWIESPALEAANRGAMRDGSLEENQQFWQEAYLPNEARYIEEHQPQYSAEIVLVNDSKNQFSINPKRVKKS